MGWTADANKTARRHNGKGLAGIQNYISRSKAVFGFTTATIVNPGALVPENLNAIARRLTQLVITRKNGLKLGRGLLFQRLASKLGVTLT